MTQKNSEGIHAERRAIGRLRHCALFAVWPMLSPAPTRWEVEITQLNGEITLRRFSTEATARAYFDKRSSADIRLV